LFLMGYPNRSRIKIWGEASVITDDPALLELVKEDTYRARIERVIKIKITAWDVNCPQHIQQRFTIEEIKPYLENL
ncbi:MAG: pyridoxamine 5'-phosphate oxidase, partial [Bacteroidota bacterium]